MLLPFLDLSLFTPEEQDILKPLIDKKTKLFADRKPPLISSESEYVWIYSIHRLYRDLRYITPYISIHDPFYNPYYYSQTLLKDPQKLSQLVDKVVANFSGGFSQPVLDHIKKQRSKA